MTTEITRDPTLEVLQEILGGTYDHTLAFPSTSINYKVDLYTPKYELAIDCAPEFDVLPEGTNTTDGIMSSGVVASTPSCVYIQYYPNGEGFDIVQLIDRINDLIYATRGCSKVQS